VQDLTGERIGFVVTGSFCMFSAAFAQAKQLISLGADLTPIFSEHAAAFSTRFSEADARRVELEQICGKAALDTIPSVETTRTKGYAGYTDCRSLYRQYGGETSLRHHRHHSNDGSKVYAAATKAHCTCHCHQRCTRSIGKKYRLIDEYPSLLFYAHASG